MLHRGIPSALEIRCVRRLMYRSLAMLVADELGAVCSDVYQAHSRQLQAPVGSLLDAAVCGHSRALSPFVAPRKLLYVLHSFRYSFSILSCRTHYWWFVAAS